MQVERTLVRRLITRRRGTITHGGRLVIFNPNIHLSKADIAAIKSLTKEKL